MSKIEEKIKIVYDFIKDYMVENGFSPSVREICASCGIKSTASAYYYLEKLKEKGSISKPNLKKRSLGLAKCQVNYRTIPLVGNVRAGTPIYAEENLEGYYPLPPEFESGKDIFALKVEGDSMINAGIKENDIIIINKQETAENGDIVVALIEDSATVKRFFKRDGKIVLHPENDNMDDMIFDNVKILGKVQGLMRKF